jgi:quercetin dioxygenase-like cupin family protein
MAITFNESTVPAEHIAPGAALQRLMDERQLPGARVVLDRLTLAVGSAVEIGVTPTNLAWFQMLDGETTLEHDSGKEELTEAHIVFLPPGFRGTLAAPAGAVVLYGEVPDAEQFDPDFVTRPPQLGIIDWTREPVLDSLPDRRSRIYIITRGLFGTRAIKGEIIFYPPGTKAASHHYEGAEHFMYVLRGRGAAYVDDVAIPLREGDLIYYGELERHYVRNDGNDDMIFVEFFVPGVYKTVWAEGAPVCIWQSTGRDIRGGKPVREIKGHTSEAVPENI